MARTDSINAQFRRATGDGLRAARTNLVPGLVLFLFAIGTVLAYQFFAPVREALEHVVRAREQAGLVFPIVSTALFGGAIPLVFRRLLLGDPAPAREVLFSVGFWAFKGMEVSLFYQFQAWAWGTGTDFQTLVLKVITDQLLYCPLLAVPDMMLAYLWFHSGFSMRKMRQAFRQRGFFERWLSVLIPNAAVWTPTLFAVYFFPTPLQLPLFNIILVFWVLTLALVAKNEPAPETTAG